MTEVRMKWNHERYDADLALTADGWDLDADRGLESAVVISLFSDRRATEDELPAGEADRRGWWGDAIDDDGDQTGSLLWLLEREKASDEIAAKSEHHVREALAWLVNDGLATALEVTAERNGECINVAIDCQLPDGRHLEYSYGDILGAGNGV